MTDTLHAWVRFPSELSTKVVPGHRPTIAARRVHLVADRGPDDERLPTTMALKKTICQVGTCGVAVWGEYARARPCTAAYVGVGEVL